MVSDPYDSNDSYDNEAPFLSTHVSPPIAVATCVTEFTMDVGVSPMLSPSPIQLIMSAHDADENQIIHLVNETNHVSFSPAGHQDNEITFLLDDENTDELGELNAFAETSFHSIQSDKSIVKKIQHMGMDPSFPVEHSSHSGSTKRRIVDNECDDDPSSALKRKRN